MSSNDDLQSILDSIKVGDIINVVLNNNSIVSGRCMPRYESSEKDHIIIKLNNGYNIGIKLNRIKSITKVSSFSIVMEELAEKSLDNSISLKSQYRNDIDLSQVSNLPKIALISTGGTIASKIDYRTGGVTSVLSAKDLYASIPELSLYASIDTEILFNEYSENIGPTQWNLIANKIIDKINSGIYDGIVISHGTDTMSYTAAALSFALQDLPIPVILVGAQRSSDRPSSDASSNLIASVIFATQLDYSGVFVSMHGSISDEQIHCHLGTRVRKNHTSKRDAFKSIDISPIAVVKEDQVEIQKIPSNIILQKKNKHKINKEFNVIPKIKFDDRVFLLKYYPGLNPLLIENVQKLGYKVIIIEGTGLGHINKNFFYSLKEVIASGMLVFMTSQCIWGRTNLNVYDTGRDLEKIGVVSLSNMLSETATVKAMWLLANYNDLDYIRNKMQENISNEITYITPIAEDAIS
ncbi:MAG TPA: Glu-tRNA(Gln) amidotransferase subunit GatD [Nitrososphaeraceae archaeon]